MMNRFETLLAPPSLTAKELGVHLKMHPELPQDVAASCRSQLVDVSVRMHDELTTRRFPVRLNTDPEAPDYRATIRAFFGSKAEPIGWAFFGDEYTAFCQEYPHTDSPEEVEEAVGQLSDPWRVQAWAAQALRVAQNAETEEPKRARKPWRMAVRLYQRFFSMTDVTTSHTHRLANDDATREQAQRAWDNFLADEVQALAERLPEYTSRQQALTAKKVLGILDTGEIHRINPRACEAAKDSTIRHFADGIRSATSLEDALKMHSIAPVSPDCERALLDALTAETKKLVKGFGDVRVIKRTCIRLGLDEPPDPSDPSLVRAAREAFYDAAASVSQVAINQSDDDHDGEMRRAAIAVMSFVPRDREIGRDSDGDSLTAGDVLDMMERVERGDPFKEVPPSVISKAAELVSILEKTPESSQAHIIARRELTELVDNNRELADALDISTTKKTETLTPQEKERLNKVTKVIDQVPLSALKEFRTLFEQLNATPSGTTDERVLRRLAKLAVEYPALAELLEIDIPSNIATGLTADKKNKKNKKTGSAAATLGVLFTTVVALTLFGGWFFGLTRLWGLFSGQTALQLGTVALGLLLPALILTILYKALSGVETPTILAVLSLCTSVGVMGGWAWGLLWLLGMCSGHLLWQIGVVTLGVLVPTLVIKKSVATTSALS